MNDVNKVVVSERNKSVFLIDGYKFCFRKNISRTIFNAILVAKKNCNHFFFFLKLI